MENLRRKKLARVQALKTERSSWDPHWRELSEYQQPRLGRFLTSGVNKGGRRHQNILDNTAMFSLRTMAAGMMSGMTSPARPWFRLGLSDKDLAEHGPAKRWLHDVTRILLDVFASSNTYRALHLCYEELGLFGTWASVVLPNFDNVVHHYPLTAGEYSLATNPEGHVDTLTREFKLTVAQCVEQFGAKNCSQTVRDLYNRGTYDAWVDVIQLIEPRKLRDVKRVDGKNKPFASYYFEPSKDNWDQYLSESGFDMFRALAPRWNVTGGDIYGQSPGMECQGDVRQLQHQQMRKGQAIDYQVNPPLQVPTSLKNRAMNRLPGGIEYYDSSGPGSGIKTMYEVNLNLGHLLDDIVDVRQRIERAYYADLFLMLANDRRSNVTATEVAERHEEKLLMLGPVLERLHEELLSKLIDITFSDAAAAKILPDPPQELQGMELEVQFISVLAQAQRAVSAQGLDRLIGTVSSMAAIWPEARHKIDPLQTVDSYADMFGVDPKVVVPDDVVAERIAAEQQQQAAQQAAAMAPMAADAAKTTSEVDVDNMGNVMQGLMGYGTPAAASA